MLTGVGERAPIRLPDVAARVDQSAGYREEISFPQVGDDRVFTVAYLPERMEAGLVICPPIMMELIKNYRQEVLLARMLAARGIAVQRFHYRGAGHSEGAELDVTAETMVEDALAAAERLRSAGARTLAFLGIRWGAQVAAAAASRGHPGAPLILWEPVVDGARYFRELVRARLVRETKDERFARPSPDGDPAAGSSPATRWQEEMAREGYADILGYALSRVFYEGVRAQRLVDLLTGGGARAVLLVQMSRQGTLRPDLAELKRAIESLSGTCAVHLIRDEPGWMFDSRRMKELPRLLQASADWLTARIGPSHA